MLATRARVIRRGVCTTRAIRGIWLSKKVYADLAFSRLMMTSPPDYQRVQPHGRPRTGDAVGRCALRVADCRINQNNRQSIRQRKSRLIQDQAAFQLVPRRGLEPPRSYPLVPETSASTNSATWAGTFYAFDLRCKLHGLKFVLPPTAKSSILASK